MRDQIGENNTCMEGNCAIEFNGKTFEAGGAFIGVNPETGKHGGVVYGDYDNHRVTNWHGDIHCHAYRGKEYHSNLGDKRCHVWFTWKGIKFHGVWCSIDWNQAIKVHEVK